MISLRHLALSALAASGAWIAAAQPEEEFRELIATSEARIEKSLTDYQALLESISDEKLELVSQINRLENSLVNLRSKREDAEQKAAAEKLQLEDLRAQIAALDTQAEYSLGVLTEFLTNFESRINVAEDQAYRGFLLDQRTRIDAAGEIAADRIPLYFESIEAGLARQEQLVGGKRFEGRAITPLGGVKDGQIAIIGPTAYFHAPDGSAAGVLRFNSGTIEPGLAPIDEAATATLSSLMASGSGSLPIDASLGKALALKKAKGTLVEHIQKGGWVGYAILALGGLSLLVGLIKTIDLQTSKIADPGDVKEIAKAAVESDTATAQSRISGLKGPLHAMISTGIEFARTDTETILEAMETVILRHQPRLERFLPFLATTAAVAPLMGLLGTVVGMIKTFTLIEVFGTGDAKSLSSGISEALVTTELGLIVAIPALILHGIFSRVMRARIGNMEQVAADFSRHVARCKEPA